jgi:hypothetical protein
VRICANCRQQVADHVTVCPRCKTDLISGSVGARELARLRADGRIRELRILSDRFCCPTCRDAAQVYPIEQVPLLPLEGCSHAVGCRCSYEPVLDVIGA